jgi:hypothetical protein
MRSTPWWTSALAVALLLTAAPGAEAKKFRYASGPKAPADTTLTEADAYLDPVVRSRGPRVPYTNLQLVEFVADRAAQRALGASPLDSGMAVTLAPAREHPMNFVLEDGLVQALTRRGVEVIVRRSPVPDDSLRLLAAPAPDPLLEYSTGSGKVSYLRLVGFLPGRVRIERQGLVQGALTLRDPLTARVLWAQDLGDNLIDRFSRSDVALVEDERYPELKAPVPSRNVDKVFEPVIVVAVVGGLVALFFQNRP